MKKRKTHIRSTNRTRTRKLSCKLCGTEFETNVPRACYCSDECRDAAANASGRGNKARRTRIRAQAIAARVANGESVDVAIKSLPKHLQFGDFAGLQRLPMTGDRITRFLGHLAKTGNMVLAAKATDGQNTIAQYRSLQLKNQQFADGIKDSLSEWAAIVYEAAVEEAVKGKKKPIVSMGEVVAHELVRDGKLLAQMLKQTDREFAKANAAGGGSTINIQNNVGGTEEASDPRDPRFSFKRSETFALTEVERDQLAAIASKILSARRAESVVIDLQPDGETKRLLELDVNIEPTEGVEDAKIVEGDEPTGPLDPDNPYDI